MAALPGSVDVVVLGAGAAGLAAACALLESGRTVAVLDARPRVGGRICTLQTHRLPVELGAEFIHGRATELEHLLKRTGLTAYDVDGARWVSSNGHLKPLDDFWDRLARGLRPLRSVGTRDRSVADVLARSSARHPLDRRLALQFVEGFNAADAALISARAVASGNAAFEPDERTLGRLVGGYGALVHWLAAPLSDRLHLSTVVRGVRWTKGRVSVDVRQDGHARAIDARAAIVTLPIGVLKASPGEPGAVQFDPPLRAKQNALDALVMGSVVRIALKFRTCFWDIANLSFLHAPHEAFPVWWTAYPLRAPLMVGWCGGPGAQRLSMLSRDQMVDRALTALSRALKVRRTRASEQLDGAWTHDWEHDPFSRGAYSYEAVGGSDAPAQLARPLQRTLFFAGEATHAEGTGTVHGAMATGGRAAKEVLRALR